MMFMYSSTTLSKKSGGLLKNEQNDFSYGNNQYQLDNNKIIFNHNNKGKLM